MFETIKIFNTVPSGNTQMIISKTKYYSQILTFFFKKNILCVALIQFSLVNST